MSSYESVMFLRNDSQPPTNPANQGGLADVVGLFRMVKILCDGPQPIMAKWLHQNDPNVVIVVRNMAVLEDPYENWDLTEANAARYWEAIQPYLNQFQDRDRYVFCLIPNEPTVDIKYPNTNTVDPVASKAQRRKLSAWWAKLGTLAKADKRKICMGNWSAEARIWQDKWQDLWDMIDACIAGDHWWDQHGYSPNLNDPAFDEFLYPWRKLRQTLTAAGFGTHASALQILAGEFGEDQNLSTNTGTAGYRLSVNNERYAAQLLGALSNLVADKVDAFIYWFAAANYEKFLDYNINLNEDTHIDGKHVILPTVWDRIRPTLAAQTSPPVSATGPIEIPPTNPPPVTPPPAFPAWYRVNTGTDRLRKRLGPSLDAEIVELQASGSELLIESIDANNWAKEKGANLYAFAGNNYLVRK